MPSFDPAKTAKKLTGKQFAMLMAIAVEPDGNADCLRLRSYLTAGGCDPDLVRLLDTGLVTDTDAHGNRLAVTNAGMLTLAART